MSDFRLISFLHQFNCPQCQQPTQHSSPGDTILFASIKCQHCGRGLVIVQNKLWEHDQGSKSQTA